MKKKIIITLVLFVIITLVLCVVILVYVGRKRIAAFLKHKQSKNEIADEVDIRVGQDFLACADSFEGLYEPMYNASLSSISQERMINVLREWNIRMNNNVGVTKCLTDWWSSVYSDLTGKSKDELQVIAQKVIQMIHSAGIIRDNREQFIAGSDICLFYQHVDDKSLEAGQRIRIDSPCWYIQCTPVRIIEKGYCEII